MGLTIDSAAAAARPSDQDFMAWAGDQRVFISSVMAGLSEERRAVADAVQRAGARPVWFEDFGGRDDDAESAYLAEVASGSIYLGILGRNYGKLLPTRLSATHTEYREAERAGLRVSVWVDVREDFQGDQLTFVEEVRLFHTTGRYEHADDLAESVTARLRDIAAEDLSPWVKLGEVIFRAHSVSDNGRDITLNGSVHSPSAVAKLEEMRPGSWGGKQQARLTYHGHSHAVRVQSVVTRVVASRATGVEITLAHASDLETNGMSMSFSVAGRTYTADEVTEINIRKALFGEPAPRGLLIIGGSIGAPLSQIPRERLSADIHSAVCGLLLTEALVGSGRASRITRLRVGPRCPDGHEVMLAWTGRSGEERQVKGHWIPG